MDRRPAVPRNGEHREIRTSLLSTQEPSRETASSHGFLDDYLEGAAGAGRQLLEQSLGLAPAQLDGIEVGAVGRQEQDVCANRTNRLLDACRVVRPTLSIMARSPRRRLGTRAALTKEGMAAPDVPPSTVIRASTPFRVSAPCRVRTGPRFLGTWPTTRSPTEAQACSRAMPIGRLDSLMKTSRFPQRPR